MSEFEGWTKTSETAGSESPIVERCVMWRAVDELFEQPVFEEETKILVTDGANQSIAYVKGFHVWHSLKNKIKGWKLVT